MDTEGFLHSQQLVQTLVIASAEEIVPSVLAAWEASAGNGGDRQIIDKM